MKLFGWAESDHNHNVHQPSTTLPAELQDDSMRFKLIVDNIEEGVLLIDDHENVQLFNPGATVITGWDQDEAIGISVHNIIQLVNEKGETLDNSQNPIVNVFKTGETQKADKDFIRSRNNKIIPITIHVSPLLDAEKNVRAAVAVITNVTQQRAEEQQRADFISTASHEMRTPVAAIEGYLALALNDKVSGIDNRARDFLEKAHASTQHLGKLFQDLLTSAKAEDGRLASHPQVIEMGEFLQKLCEDLRLVAEQKGLKLDFTSGNTNRTIVANEEVQAKEKVIRPLYFVYADPDRIREVVTNLFDNAVKYTPEGKVSIGVNGNKQVVQCYVRDTGPGIPADDLPHLFQKFYRVDNSATRTIGGTGLGLFICKKIVELYDGRIWVESRLGEGSSFYINLPRLSTQRATELSNNNVIAPEAKPGGA